MKRKSLLVLALIVVISTTLTTGLYADTVVSNMMNNPGLTNLYPANTFYGYVGCYFTVSEEITVTSLGAPYIAGNTSTTVRIAEVSGTVSGNLAPSAVSNIASAVVPTNSSTKDSLGYNYTALSTGVTLSTGKNYFILLTSDPTNYPLFYDKITFSQTNPIITIKNSVFANDEVYIVESGEFGNGYFFAKPTFTFNSVTTSSTVSSTSSSSISSSQTSSVASSSSESEAADLSSALAEFDTTKHSLVTSGVHIGEAGYVFTAQKDGITVTSLGVPAIANATGSKVNLYLVNAKLPDVGATIPASNLQLLATANVTVNSQSKDSMGFNYALLANGIELLKGKTYLIQMTSNTQTYPSLYYPNGAASVVTDTTNSAIQIISPSYSVGGETNLVSDGAYTVYDLAQPGRTFGTPNFLFKIKTTDTVSGSQENSDDNAQTSDSGVVKSLIILLVALLTAAIAKLSKRKATFVEGN